MSSGCSHNVGIFEILEDCVLSFTKVREEFIAGTDRVEETVYTGRSVGMGREGVSVIPSISPCQVIFKPSAITSRSNLKKFFSRCS